MPTEIVVSSAHVHRAFIHAMNLAPAKRTNFFSDIREALRDAFEEAMAEVGLQAAKWDVRSNLSKSQAIDSGTPIRHRESADQQIASLDAEFCARYGSSDYSVSAINYLKRLDAKLPSLRAFLEVDSFSAGNILVPLIPGTADIRFTPRSPLRFVGHIAETASRKRKPYIAALGVHFDRSALSKLLGESTQLTNHEHCQLEWLDEVHIDIIHFPILYICRYCGKLHTCQCFAPYVDDRSEIRRFLDRRENRQRAPSLVLMNGICHLCRGSVPRHAYGSSMYYSSFAQRYLPYIELFARRANLNLVHERRVVENQVRARFGFPAIGERWGSETILFRVVQALVAPHETIHHYRGKELEGLELDIWIPELKLGIEYQGEQHYEAIKHWGGEDGLAKRKANDHRKRALCKNLGYTLVEFRFDEELTEAVVLSRIKRHLPPIDPSPP